MEFLRSKKWIIPENVNGVIVKKEYTQDIFYSEYFPTSHKIFDRIYYPDVKEVDENGKVVKLHSINRIAVPFQRMSVTIILAHLLGNKTYLSDSTLKDNPSLPLYREYWDESNIDVARFELIETALSLGDGAVLFYKDEENLRHMVLTAFDGDEFYMEYDKYKEPHRFFRYYDDKCDVYDKTNVRTYQVNSQKNGKKGFQQINQAAHGFKGMPVAYHKRRDGAFWTPVQGNIDNIELMLSRLSEDNRGKFKSLYHLGTDNPDDIETSKAGTMDMVVTDKDGEFKLIPPAQISTQFEFEYHTLKEIIFDGLGIVFPKHKSSGDMPTGSMKMMFYPTEREVMKLINEFDTVIDQINNIVKQGFVMEHPKRQTDITDGNIKASIRMFTPQDEIARNDNIANLYQKGVISEETAAEEISIAANNEIDRKEREKDKELEAEKKRSDLRVPLI